MNDPVDLSNLRDITGGDEDLEKELFGEFIQTVEDCIHALEGCYSDEKKETWREKSHSLKGISLNLGAKHLAELAHHSQEIFAEPSAKKQVVLADIQLEYGRVRQFLLNEIK